MSALTRSVELVQLPPAPANARTAFPSRPGALVRLTGDARHAGVGEAAPLPGYSPDRLDDVLAALRGLPPLAGALEEVALLPAALPAARFALETALLELRGGLAAFLGRAPRPFPRARLIADLAAAEDAVAAGVRTLKIKIGVPGDLALLAVLRRRFGDEVALRLDANGALAPEDLAAYAAARPELVEEPVADPRALPAAPFPVALDESLQHLDAATVAALARAGRIQALVLKPTTLGGALRCLRLAALAAELGLGVAVGHTFEGPVGRRAVAALAASLPGRVLACGV